MDNWEVIPASQAIGDVSGALWIENMNARFDVSRSQVTMIGLGSELSLNSVILDAHELFALVGGFAQKADAIMGV